MQNCVLNLVLWMVWLIYWNKMFQYKIIWILSNHIMRKFLEIYYSDIVRKKRCWCFFKYIPKYILSQWKGVRFVLFNDRMICVFEVNLCDRQVSMNGKWWYLPKHETPQVHRHAKKMIWVFLSTHEKYLGIDNVTRNWFCSSYCI